MAVSHRIDTKCGSWELNLGPLEEQVLLTPELSLQLLSLYLRQGLDVLSRLAFNLISSCLGLLCAGITGLCHHAGPQATSLNSHRSWTLFRSWCLPAVGSGGNIEQRQLHVVDSSNC